MKDRRVFRLLVTAGTAASAFFALWLGSGTAMAGQLRPLAPAPAASAARTYEGSLDLSFDPGTGADEAIEAIVLQPDGRVLVGGAFTGYDGVTRSHIARLNSDGSLDPSFDPGAGTGAGTRIYDVALQPDGKVVIGGYFATYDGQPSRGIARLNPDGSLDATFDPETGVNGEVYAIVLQPDGKMVIGGAFDGYDGVARNNIARINADGSLDATFDPGAGADDRVESLALQPDGKVLIGGYFNGYDGAVRHHLARLNADGSLDALFDPGAVEDQFATVYAIVVQPDGKVLVGGSFTQYDGVARAGIARANPDGSLDTTFDPAEGANDAVHAIQLQPDGRVLIAGAFGSINYVERRGVARLRANGSLDTSFDPGTGADSVLFDMVRQPNGQVLIGGDLITYDGVGRNRVARVNGSGFNLLVPLVLRQG